MLIQRYHTKDESPLPRQFVMPRAYLDVRNLLTKDDLKA